VGEKFTQRVKGYKQITEELKRTIAELEKELAASVSESEKTTKTSDIAIAQKLLSELSVPEKGTMAHEVDHKTQIQTELQGLITEYQGKVNSNTGDAQAQVELDMANKLMVKLGALDTDLIQKDVEAKENGEIQRLKSELDGLKTELTETQKKYDDVTKNNTKLNERHDKMKKQCDDADKNYTDLNEQYEELKKQCATDGVVNVSVPDGTFEDVQPKLEQATSPTTNTQPPLHYPSHPSKHAPVAQNGVLDTTTEIVGVNTRPPLTNSYGKVVKKGTRIKR
jgi:chromosome segregation ATPase